MIIEQSRRTRKKHVKKKKGEWKNGITDFFRTDIYASTASILHHIPFWKSLYTQFLRKIIKNTGEDQTGILEKFAYYINMLTLYKPEGIVMVMLSV